MKIIPTPKQQTMHSGSFTLDKKLTLVVPDIKNQNFKALAPELVNSFFCGNCTLDVTVSHNLPEKTAYIVPEGASLCACSDITSDLDYTLAVTKDGVILGFNDERGLVHAFVTFLMATECVDEGVYSCPCMDIADKPDIHTRAVHFCVFPETPLDFLRKTVRLCGMMKYTHIIIEFWGMYKYRFTDILSWKEAYTAEQIKPIIDDIRAFGAQPVPMMNFFGHATQSRACSGKHATLDVHPEKEWMFEPEGWAWKVDNPKVYSFLEDAVKELCELFGEGEYFHFGCDEVYSVANKSNPGEYVANHFNNISKTAAKFGRKAIIWGDMLLNVAEIPDTGERIECDCLHETYTHIDTIDKENILIADWQYNITKEACHTAEYFIKHGYRPILCPWHNMHNIRFLCKEAKRLDLGVMLTTWHTLRKNFYMLPIYALAAWSGKMHDEPGDHGVMTGTMATLLRKILPSEGNYKNAGWQDDQLKYN